MRKRNLRVVILAALALGVVVGAASPAFGNHTGFEKGEYQVRETDSYVELSVSTTCCPVWSGQVDYYTANSSAIAGEDYKQTSGTLTYPAEQTIRVPITNDQVFEGEEQFEVRLTNWRPPPPFAVAPGPPAVVRISDDDPKPSSNSTSTTGSSQQTSANSSGSSPLRSPSPHPSGAGRQPDSDTARLAESPASEDGIVTADQTYTRENGDQLAAEGLREGGRSSLPFVALGALLIIGLAILLWFRFRRAAPS